MTGAKNDVFRLLRGPVLICSVTFSVTIPLLLKLSTTTQIHLLVALLGALMFFHDTIKFAKSRIRTSISYFLDQMILDDVLQAIYDPETGLIACLVGALVGTQSMYALRMNADQRIKLVQASLWTSEDDARTILFQSGGIKNLLPKNAQNWLNSKAPTATPEAIHVKPGMEQIDIEGASSNGSLSDGNASNREDEASSLAPEENCTMSSNGIINEEEMDEQDRNRFADREYHSSEHGHVDPTDVMISILKEIALERVRPFVASMPETALETVGAAAALAVAVQLFIRRRSRTSLIGVASATTLSGISIGAFSAILARHAVLGNICDLDSLKLVSKAVLLRTWQRLRREAEKKSELKRTLAMLVLILLGRHQMTKNHGLQM